MGFKKQFLKVLSLVCVVFILFSGCKDTESKDNVPKTGGKTVIEYNDVSLDARQILLKMNSYLSRYGMSLGSLAEDEDIWERFKRDIVFELSASSLALEKAEELGLDQISTDEQKSLDEKYQQALAAADEFVKAEMSELDIEESEFDSEYDKRLEKYFFERGYDLSNYENKIKEELIIEKVKMHFTKDISVSDAEVRQEYEKSLAMQKDSVENQPSFIEQQLMMGDEVLYYPEGYMFAKHILISFDSKIRGAAAIAYENKEMEKYNELVEDGYEQIKPEIDQIIQELNAGEDFDSMILKYSDDEFFSEEPYKTQGIMIGPHSSSFGVPEYLEALDKIEEGGFSEPVITFLGCFIIKNEKTLAGEVPFDDVKDIVKENLLNQRRSFQWSSLNQQWIDEAEKNGDLKTFPENIDDYVLSGESPK